MLYKLLKSKISIIILTIFALNTSVIAQKAILRGFVYDKETGEPVLFTNVYLKGTTFGAATDVNGFYSITNIPEGKYIFTVSFIGYDTLSEEITIIKDKIISKNVNLTQSSIKMDMVEISAERKDAVNNVRMSVTKITPKEISHLPSISGEPDLAQYMQVVPGVVFTGDQGGQLYIRGGSPIQNLVLLDGMIIYNPFHSIGLFSVFDPDIIRNADIYTGGFNAKYGGRISSVMDITTRDGNKSKLSGKISANPFSSKIIIEGPLKKPSINKKANTSFIISAKNSYLDQSSKMIYNYISEEGLPYTFTDLYGKFSTSSQEGSKLNLFGFNYRDRVNYQEVSDLNWNSYGAGANFVLLPSNSNVLMEGIFAYSYYGINLIEEGSAPRFSNIDGFNAGLNFSYYLGKDEFKYGFSFIGNQTDYTFENSSGGLVSDNMNNTEFAAFFTYKLSRNKILFEPGLHFHKFTGQPGALFEPRIGIKYKLTDYLRLKASTGIFNQNLISTTSEQDVVALFTGFLSDPQSIPSFFEGIEINRTLQKAKHLITGFELDITKRVSLNIEAYIKDYELLISLNRNKIYADTPENSDISDLNKSDFVYESGISQGVDFVLNYDYKRIYLWLVYSYGISDRFDGIMEYRPHFDRRHNINLIGSYNFGKNYNWELSARWNMGSGFPFTKTQAFYEQIYFNDGISTDYTSINGNLNVLYGTLNEGRLPYYHRLDLSIKKIWLLGNKSELNAIASVTNAYNRDNIFYFNRIKHKKVNQLPILPSVGISLTF